MVNFTMAPAFSQTSTTFGNPYTGGETLTEDLIYTDGEFELRVDKHLPLVDPYRSHAGEITKSVLPAGIYGGNENMTKSVNSFLVDFLCFYPASPNHRQTLAKEVGYNINGDGRKYSYKVQIAPEAGNVCWIIPYKMGQVIMRDMDQILISGTCYSMDGTLNYGPWHATVVPDASVNRDSYFSNKLNIQISNSNSFIFEKGNCAEKTTGVAKLGALASTDSTITLTNVEQVSLNDNISRVVAETIFTWENTGTGKGTFSGNKNVIFDYKSGVTIEGVEQVDFENNENTIFKDALAEKVIFKKIGTLVFNKNTAETGVITKGSYSSSGSYVNVVGDMMFEDVDTLKFTENTATKEYLFTHLAPHTQNCGEIYITNNTAEQGSVLCGVEGTSVSLNFEGTKKGLHINKNTASYEEDYSKAVLVKGHITASGSSEKQAVFEMNENTGNGTFTGLLGGDSQTQLICFSIDFR